MVLGIKDQGKGLDPSIKEKIGKPFNTTKEGGSGLGLTVCYKIAEKYGADVAVETGLVGTLFSVKFKKCVGVGCNVRYLSIFSRMYLVLLRLLELNNEIGFRR